MKSVLRISLMTVFLLTTLSGVHGLSAVRAASAASPTSGFVVVSWGDTLYAIAARTGTTVDALVRANSLPSANFIYAGQRLIIPPGNSPSNPLPNASVYTVTRGDTLATVAARFGTTVAEMMRANGLYNPNFIFVGQRLNIPSRAARPAPQPGPAPASPPAPGKAPNAPTTGKWIDIDLSEQRTTAYQGTTPLKSVIVSTGVAATPTPIGRFKVYMKIASQTMSGGYGASYYYLPGVPWVMYFTGAYAIHGTYWHRNFGRPMSRGCVNLTIEDAKWFYDWAEIGTPVVVHP